MAQITNSITDYRCSQCQGKCWKEGNNAATQKAARAMFGITPNNCIPDSLNGKSHCPFNL